MLIKLPKMIQLIFQIAVIASLSNLIFCATVKPSEENNTFVNPRSRLTDDEDDSDICPMKNLKHPVYLPHPTDCNKFYICDRGSSHLKTCMPGLHFNRKLNVCDYPEKAGCDEDTYVNPRNRITDDEDNSDICPMKNFKLPIYLPHPTDCSKFYICDTGKAHLKTCIPGLHFNRKLKVCDYPGKAGCDEDTVVNPRNKITADDEDDSGICPKKNLKHPIYLPHPTDCNKFYICDRGSEHLKTCMPGLHFNRKLNVCDYPEKAGCDEDDTNDTKVPKGKLIEDIDESICPKRRYPVLLPHPKSCTKFFMCENGKAHVKECRDGLHFNKRFQTCDYPEKAECDADDTEMPKGKVIGDIDESICPKRRYPVLLPHPKDCSKFYMCENGKAHVKECRDGLHFNKKFQTCDYPDKAGCDTGNTEIPKGKVVGDIDAGICPKRRYPVSIPHPEDCKKFYMCDNGKHHLKECPKGLHFNKRLQTCDYPDKAGCYAEAETKQKFEEKDLTQTESKHKFEEIEVAAFQICPVKSKEVVLLPHPTDCEVFYECRDGSAYLQSCRPGLYFNSNQQNCVQPENSGCTEASESCSVKDDGLFFQPDPMDCTLFQHCFNGIQYLRSCPEGLHFNFIQQVCDFPHDAGCEENRALSSSRNVVQRAPGVQSPFCPSLDGKIPIFYRSSSNCSVYYMCSHGLAYQFICPARLHFNLRKRMCDYEENAKCRIEFV